jgi:thiosulfate/3-mercaptopyruvate sulfurtransferase
MIYLSLISATELAGHVDDPDWLVVDCRFDLANTEKGREAHHAGHIPGAFYAHLDQQLSSSISAQSGRHPLPDFERLRAWLGSIGFDGTQQVVVYDDSGGAMAVRLWWLLKGLGHAAVALLDGGFQAWQEQGLPLDDKLATSSGAGFHGDFDDALVVTSEQVEANLESAQFILVDVRTAERFQGVNEPIDPVAGHIPGAVNLPLGDNLDAEGRFKPADQLRELYAPLVQQREPHDLVFMCGSGVTACHSVFAMVRAGYAMPRLYAGSWSEWIRDPSRPLATGQASSV